MKTTQTDTLLRKKGMNMLVTHLGKVEAERFISLINREPFDYTEWQSNLFNDMSVKQLSQLAMKDYKKNKTKDKKLLDSK